MPKVIAFGEVLVDLLAHPDPEAGWSGSLGEFTAFPGGAPANVAAAVARLGGHSAFAGKIGDDAFGTALKATLEDFGVDTGAVSVARGANTPLALVTLDAHGERSFAFYRTATADLKFSSEDLDAVPFTGGDILHVCSNTLTEAPIRVVTETAVARARDAGCLISLDVNLRPGLWPAGSDPLTAIQALAEQADVIKLSREELDFVSGARSESDWLSAMQADRARLIVVTDADAPVRVCLRHAEHEVNPPAIEMTDSTAAGDAFVGGLLYRLAQSGLRPETLPGWLEDAEAALLESVRFACACGAFAAMHKGAFTSLPSVDDLARHFPGLTDLT
ncbi:MAG: carbohydrate kinase [Gammaproteobacteria bacterium]|nr:MAG: carbohydrate kinase [Gammaproteobacteria bacterium]